VSEGIVKILNLFNIGTRFAEKFFKESSSW